MAPVKGSGPKARYARSNSAEHIRARKILAFNSPSEDKCAPCIKRKQKCYRHPKYKKCAFCTARSILKGYCQAESKQPSRAKDSLDHKSPTSKGSAEHQILHERHLDLPSPDSSRLGDRNKHAKAGAKAGRESPNEETKEMNNHGGQVTAMKNPSIALLDARIAVLEDQVSTLLNTRANWLKKNEEIETDTDSHNTEKAPPNEPSLGQLKTYIDGIQDGTLMEHSIAHTPGWTPLNCICALPFNGKRNSSSVGDVEHGGL